MKTESSSFIISDLSLPFDTPDIENEIINLAKKRMKRVGADPAQLHFRLYKKSLDARKNNCIKVVCSVIADADGPVCVKTEKLSEFSVKAANRSEPKPVFGSERLNARPLVVGMGPCGMFCALLLAENGYKPILIDRGESVSKRVSEVERFYTEKVLNTSTNIQFGAGGAGTFSDGKLVTRINDENCNYVLRTFRDFGAPADILTNAKPHIGTDVLRGVVENILLRIEELGGTLLYNTKLESITELPDHTLCVGTNAGDIKCGAAVVAVGHSARDTYGMLADSGFELLPKPFSVGVRIEHLQEDVDRSLFGGFAGHPMLGKGEYNLAYTKGDRGVYTFCMCPGGEVVAATSEHGGVVVNGMSRYARDGRNANSAIAVSVLPSDCGNSIFGAIDFQRRLERAAFAAGGSDYAAPVETVGDFLDGFKGTEPKKVLPSYMNGHVKVSDIELVLPDFVASGLKIGITAFGKKMDCFNDRNAVISGVETRTSAPLTIRRNSELYTERCDLVYPCGEGAGYAGGITSAAVDGVKVAMKIMGRFSNDI